MNTLLDLYVILCTTALLQAALMFLHAWEHSRYHASRRFSDLQPESAARVTLFVPCKGLDVNLDANLRALFEQHYPQYELCFVVERETEPVVEMIGELRRRYPRVPCRIISAGEATNCGQKVHNLMMATRTVGPGTEIMAFVDSDACPHPHWLARLVERLRSDKYAVSTGYRWYNPVQPTGPNLLLSAINNTISGLMGAHGFNLVWGGAWAIRTETFHLLGLPDAWQGSLSDDLVVSKLVHRAGLKLVYEPHCLVTSVADTGYAALAEFIRRQYLVVRIYAPLWWLAAFCAGAVMNLAFWSSLGLMVAWGITRGPWWIAAGMGLVLYALTGCRAAICTAAVRPFINVPQPAFDRVARRSVWGWPLIALVNWIGLLSAGVGRTIVWRGIRYRLVSPIETVIESRDPQRVVLPSFGSAAQSRRKPSPTIRAA